MALSWQPDASSLQQIMILLKESQSPDTKTQQDLKPVSGSPERRDWLAGSVVELVLSVCE